MVGGGLSLGSFGKSMLAPPYLAAIWDGGWLRSESIALPSATSDHTLIESYVGSPQFHVSFISSMSGSDIHGPFIGAQIVAADFVEFYDDALEDYLGQLLYSSEWDSPASAEQFATVLRLLRQHFEQGQRCYRLRFDETDKGRQHEAGFTFVVFREFLFLGAIPGQITRLVIGYD